MDEQTTNKFLPHTYGIAIDINNVYNPAIIADGKVSPQSGRKYLNRTLQPKGMIRENDPVFKIFTERGWCWGGFFPSGADCLHFFKLLMRNACALQSVEYAAMVH